MKKLNTVIYIIGAITLTLLTLIMVIQENEKTVLKEANDVLRAENHILTEYRVAEDKELFIYNTELNIENVQRYLILFDIESSDIVLRQSLLETGNFTSYICKENNNIFGFRKSKHTYYTYPHWIMSIAAYKVWQERVYDKCSHKNYYDFLLNIGYAEDVEYINKLKRM